MFISLLFTALMCQPNACLEAPKLTVEQRIRVEAPKYGVNPETAVRIAFAESSFREKAVNHNTNGSNDMGVFQINSIHGVPDSCRLDADCNIQWALKKMSKVGTQPWYSSKHKWH